MIRAVFLHQIDAHNFDTISRITRPAILPTALIWILYLAIFKQSPDAPVSVLILFVIFVVIVEAIIAIRSKKAA